MKATINDVAKQAGVSIKTVSRVMNNEPSVRQPTREKVMAAVEALNYQPNLAARNLAGSKAYSIGFVYDNPNAYYIIDMQNGILSACKKQGFELSEAVFYSDSHADLPLLDAVNQPVVLNPNRQLAELAIQRGWPRVDWRKN